MQFATPAALVLAVLALPVAWLLLSRRRRPIDVPLGLGLAGLRPSFRLRLARLLPVLRVLAVILLAVAVAGPRIGDANAVVPAKGIDIALAIDISSSMSTSQFGPTRGTTRLDATKKVVSDFINQRKDDRIGLVVFQEQALSLSPLTLDYRALTQLVSGLDSNLLPDGTAIGLGLSEALNMLRDSTAASRIVILLTDGEENAPSISGRDAAQIAAALKVRVYTIGLVGDPIDVNLLQDVASSTGGKFYKADNPKTLADIYTEIGQLETSKVERQHFERFTELAPWFAAGAAAFLVADFLLGATWLRRAPA